MRIAILADDSLPDSTLVHAKMLHELASEYEKNGHSVIMIVPGEPKQRDRLVVNQIDNITYWRFRAPKQRGNGKLKRAINETLLSLRAWMAIKDSLSKTSLDLVIYYSPSIFFGYLVEKIKKTTSCKSYLILRDMFPQWAIDEGLIKKGTIVEKYFRFFENVNYRAADSIGLMSPKNLELFETLNGDDYNTEVLFNWTDSSVANQKLDSFNLRKKFGLVDKIIFFYGGNIGHAQDMPNLLRLAESMKEHADAHFVFLGQGDQVDLVLSSIEDKQLSNCTFIPSVTQYDYKLILNEVDVGLFSLSAKHTAHNFPGKLLGYMAHSLPILGSVNFGNDLKGIVQKANAGYICVNGQDSELLEYAKVLAKNSEVRKEVGKNGRLLLTESFCVTAATKQILDSYKNCGEHGRF